MGELLRTEKIKESFIAVQAFLRSAGFNKINHQIELVLKVYDSRQNYNGIFEIECKEYLEDESYIIHSDVFKANGYYRPVWSSYVYMTFDNSSRELEFELEGIKYNLTH
ncbi:hypothetical protein ACI6PS_06030 [Flavobacterium sp. PLA-1-15]|uniref:hypothetical protein n=1 Tax=Flavobacterium sp. PLA-1-15 TaxID=3380533 RepID=UPI003B797EF4